MKKDLPSPVQQSTPQGGSLNIIPMTYRISDKPIGDEKLYGPLAHVEDEMRIKIMNSGFGEMQLHVEHIKRSINYIRKSRAKMGNSVQLGLQLGEPKV
jgi:hypothetical protein